MSAFRSSRIAWSVAFASLALWAFSAPMSWGQVASGASRMFDIQADDTANDTTTVINITQDTTVTAVSSNADSAPCPPVPPAIAQLLPTLTPPVAPSAVNSNSNSAMFRLCGADPQAEQAIAQLIAGRAFNAKLFAGGDGCAELTITATSQSPTSGSSSTNLSVSLGSGRNLSIKIASESGVTRVSIGSS
jgi:hypothetical protein